MIKVSAEFGSEIILAKANQIVESAAATKPVNVPKEKIKLYNAACDYPNRYEDIIKQFAVNYAENTLEFSSKITYLKEPQDDLEVGFEYKFEWLRKFSIIGNTIRYKYPSLIMSWDFFRSGY